VHKLFVVVEGEVELLSRLPRGGRVAMAIVRRGGVLGDVPLLLQAPMPFDAVASRATWTIEVGEEQWTALLRQFPALCLRWMASIARRLDADRRRFVVLTTGSLPAQVAFILLEQQEPDGSRCVAKLTQEVVAELIGARRQSVTKTLKEMSSQGLVTPRYGEVELRDLDGLRALLPAGLVPA
jgi:CRP-like cAMP-binding protein